MKNLFRLLIIIVIVLLCNEFNAEAQTKVISMQTASDYFDRYHKKEADTANYWVKDISYEHYDGTYKTVLLPRYDTVMCYTLIIISSIENDNTDMSGVERLSTQWLRIWAIRDREKVVKYCNDYKEPIRAKIIQTVLLTPIFKY